ncbi:hypothetical protein AWM75_00895 [Aerococcus urinaehominis]|uniref:Uncharacterized protein n=1 Tax=Aerococcus urinaehominis TaxID=128944 RepID=A0A0X8FJY9_9LACT|nr:FAD/NAD(P)-binding protein [Aerococcus urinaehominis]AMB98637.1 hypothetical protein AWM75_00895 [Aerococcus urinaehominis]SDL96396.1 FAD-NAD(P)-binding [Aerococcus urinaehominis]
MRIAIVGAGVAGSSVLRTLLSVGPSTSPLEIDVYDYRTELSKGLPYQQDSDCLLLNSAASRVSAVRDQPNDFVTWLAQAGLSDDTLQGMARRQHYGDYLNQVFAPYFASDCVQVYHHKVVDVALVDANKPASGYRLKFSQAEASPTTKNGQPDAWSSVYQAVFLCIGHPPYADYYHLSECSQYVGTPYPAKTQLAHLDPTKRIGIIGSSATAFDIWRYIRTNYELKQPLTFYVRQRPFTVAEVILADDQALILSIDDDWLNQAQDEAGFISLDKILAQVRCDFQAMGIDWQPLVWREAIGDLSDNIRQFYQQDQELALLQAYISEITAYLPDLYNSLNHADRQRYDRLYRQMLNISAIQYLIKLWQIYCRKWLKAA